MKPSLRWTRRIIRSSIMVIFCLLTAIMVYPLGIKNHILTALSSLDPWYLIGRLGDPREIPLWAAVSLITLLATLWWGRVFCSFICPLGLLLEWTDWLGRWLKRKLSFQNKSIVALLKPYRYYWLALIMVVFIISGSWIVFLTPFNLLGHEVVRAATGLIPWTLLGIGLATMFGGRFWCSFICPTGLLQTLIAKVRRHGYVTDASCNHCGKCARVCQVTAAPANEGAADEGCLVCGACQEVCPLHSINWGKMPNLQRYPADQISDPIVPAISRRTLVTGMTVVAGAALLWNMIWTKAVQAQSKFLRPPGARLEPEFNEMCSRCGRCLKVCPTRALWPIPVYGGLDNFETPQFIPRRGRCDLCMACQEICPTGAILKVPTEQVKIGTASVDQTRCLAWTEQKLCFLCGEQCPFLAIQGDELVRPTVVEEMCVGCGACEFGCPVEGEAAIRVFRD